MRDEARFSSRRARRAVLIGALAGASVAMPATGQTVPSVSQPVVQVLPSQDSLRLSSALSRLGRDPRDVNALVDAGNAALSLGDVEAAVGFYKRANQVSPTDPRVKSGLAGAMVHSGDPIGAIALFDEAQKAGANAAAMAAERGLAYDLIGDNATAQRHYRTALAARRDDEIVRRLAISLAISGDARGLEDTLSPLLRQQDKAAWRTRAFSLAILGKTDEAVRISRTILPEALANQVAPYMRYMPQLTRAQQAAAANLGTFPRASDIGRDDPRIAAITPQRPRVASADTALVPRGEALGSKPGQKATRETRRDERRASLQERRAAEKREREAERAAAASRSAQVAARVAPPEIRPTRAASEELPAVADRPAAAPPPVRVAANTPRSTAAPRSPAPSSSVRPQPAPAREPVESPAALLARATPGATTRTDAAPTSAPVVSSASPAAGLAAAIPVRTPPPASETRASAATTAPVASGRTGSAAPGFDLAQLPSMLGNAPVSGRAEADLPLPGIAESPPVAATLPTGVSPAREVRPSLAEAFSDLSGPVAAVPAAPAPGAVDITRITPAKPKPPAKVEPAKVAAAKEAPAKPAAPSHPSRIWVQLGIGREVKAMVFDWRRLAKKSPELFKSRKGYVSDMGQTNRLITGPFGSAKEANAFVASLVKAGFDGPYVWNSPAGQIVDALPGG